MKARHFSATFFAMLRLWQLRFDLWYSRALVICLCDVRRDVISDGVMVELIKQQELGREIVAVKSQCTPRS
jgi:hypothetical protein